MSQSRLGVLALRCSVVAVLGTCDVNGDGNRFSSVRFR